MVNIRKFCVISSLVTALTIAPVIEFSAFNLSPSPAIAQFNFFSFWRRQPPVPLGTRSGLCPLTPGLLDNDATVMNDRPLFAWKGQAVKLIVRDDTQTKIWETKLDPNTQQIEYNGNTPLQPDRFYYWQILSTGSSGAIEPWRSMRVMSAVDRAPHLAKLKEIAQKGKSAETIADQQANYLLDPNRNLWSDAVKVLSEVKNPSAAFVEARSEFMTNLCTKTQQAQPR